MGIIDSHHHLWDLNLFEYDWMPKDDNILRQSYLPIDLAPILEKNDVVGSVLVQADQTGGEAKFLIDCANGVPWIKGVVAWVDLQNENVGESLDELMGLGPLVGVRHQVEGEIDDNWLLRKSTIAGLKEVSDRNLTYDLLVKRHQLYQIPLVCEELPDLRMVLDHIAKPDILARAMQPWSDDIEKLGHFDNLFCKVSGMITEADQTNWTRFDLLPFVKHVREVFGIKRLMWGSDWPVCLLAGSYEEVMEAALFAMGNMSTEEKDRFLSGTATEFYRLG
ncbi:MAG TPA: amidohydrolase [Dehalococcoidia bacterium]|nr:amidohydrolase [Dehalococcoidia bacterium]